jgi:hypothetical protein
MFDYASAGNDGLPWLGMVGRLLTNLYSGGVVRNENPLSPEKWQARLNYVPSDPKTPSEQIYSIMITREHAQNVLARIASITHSPPSYRLVDNNCAVLSMRVAGLNGGGDFRPIGQLNYIQKFGVNRVK